MIPYRTFPQLGLPFLFTHGLLVAAGIIVGAWVGKRHLEKRDLGAEVFYNYALWAAVAGIIGARLAWLFSDPGLLAADPFAIFKVWHGGLTFYGGLIGAAAITPFWLRRHRDIGTRGFLDAASIGLVLGLGIGRAGCAAVGDHFGRETDFFLGVRYLGGPVPEPFLGDAPLEIGARFHSLAIYEMLFLFALFGVLLLVRRRGTTAGTLAVWAGIAYAVARFAFDFLRVNDMRVLGLTGAQYASVALFAVCLWYWFHLRQEQRGQAPVEEEAAGGTRRGSHARLRS